MKNILIVHAHPEPNSFCSALKQTAIDFFHSKNINTEIIDLYQVGFNPVGGKNDFISLNDEVYFKYQMEQLNACKNNLFVEDIKQNMDKLLQCDLLIFNFPLWWFGLPAILKGWVDRTFAMGLVYGNGKGVYDNGIFKTKTAFACLTTGGPEIAYNGGKNGDIMQILFPINHGIFYFAGMRVIEPFISYAPIRKDDAERKNEIARYQKFLSNINTAKPIYL